MSAARSSPKTKRPAAKKPATPKKPAAKRASAKKPIVKKAPTMKPAAKTAKKAVAKTTASTTTKNVAGKSTPKKATPKPAAKSKPVVKSKVAARPTTRKAAPRPAAKAKPRTGAQVKAEVEKLTENLRVTANAPKPDAGTAAATPAKGLSADKMALYGRAMWLLGRSAEHRSLFLADMDWLIVPPIALGQYRLWRQKGIPIGFANWAYVTQDVADRVQSEMDAGRIPKLAPFEWKCGDQPLLMDLVAPFGGEEELMTELGNLGVLNDANIQ